jgi:DNA repair exonuclease SbcCD ATPase subunit
VDLQQLKKHLQTGIGKRDALTEQLTKAKAQKTTLEETLADGLLAQALAQTTAKSTQDQLTFHIKDLVQSALDSVFPDKYVFGAEFEIKRGRSEARLFLEKDGIERDPMNANGGGIVDIISVALRMACWCLSRSENVLLFDEPFKYLSAQYRPMMAEMLAVMAKRLGLQIIMVTHDPDMMAIADRVFEVSQNSSGISSIQVRDVVQDFV